MNVDDDADDDHDDNDDDVDGDDDADDDYDADDNDDHDADDDNDDVVNADDGVDADDVERIVNKPMQPEVDDSVLVNQRGRPWTHDVVMVQRTIQKMLE